MEDFFQRIINVQWDEEPECFFAVGDGGPIVNYRSYGGGNIYTSRDGKDWKLTIANLESGSEGSATGLYCGLWMRQGFRYEGKPVWILGGQGLSGSSDQATFGGVRPVLAISLDGMDHIAQKFFKMGGLDGGGPATSAVGALEVIPPTKTPQYALAKTVYNPGSGQQELGTTVDGVNWTNIVDERGSPESGEIPAGIPVAGQEITAGGKDERITDTNMIFRRSAYAAHGTVRKGALAGRRLRIQGHPNPQGGANPYFDPDVTITDFNSGVQVGAANTGVQFGFGMGYGRYVFVVAGSNFHTPDMPGCISWSDDGVTWNPQQISPWGCTCVAIGPRTVPASTS